MAAPTHKYPWHPVFYSCGPIEPHLPRGRRPQHSFITEISKYAQMSQMGQSLQCAYDRAGPQVRFGPKTDLIPMLNPVAHASRLCNRAEEYDHAGSSECDPRARASAVEQRKADRG